MNSKHRTDFHVRAFPGLTVLCALFVFVAPVLAKRSAPKPVPPVVVGRMEYSAPVDSMGFVVATNAENHKELWRVRVYSVAINPFLERDVQDVFITSLAVEDGSLIITNERGARFVLNLATRKVTVRK